MKKLFGRAWVLAALPLLAFFLIPILAIFGAADPREVLASLGKREVLDAVRVSFSTTFVSLGITLLTGMPVAYLMGRHQFRGKRVLDTLIDLPTVLPPSVAGIALLLALGRRSFIGSLLQPLGITLAFTPAAVVIAQVFISSPYFVRSLALGFASVDREIIQAAQMDGANRWEVFRYILVPMTGYAMLSGAVMSWARALGEFGATIIFAGNYAGRTQTMPLAIYLGFEVNLNTAVTLAVILMGVSFATILIVKYLVDRNLE